MEVKYNLHVVELRVTITRVRNNQWQTLKEEDIEKITEEEVRAEVELLKKQINDLPGAPYGLKKDGTPKKKIGRPRKTK